MLKRIALFTASLLAATSANATIVTIDWQSTDPLLSNITGQIVYDSETPLDPFRSPTLGTRFAQQTRNSVWDVLGTRLELPATPFAAYNRDLMGLPMNLLSFTTPIVSGLNENFFIVAFPTLQQFWQPDGGLPNRIETPNCAGCDRGVFVYVTQNTFLFPVEVAFTVSYFEPAGVVPEPATWAMMIGGMGMVGGALRSRRRNTRTTVTFA